MDTESLIRDATPEALIRILNGIPFNHKLSALEEFGIRVTVKKLKELANRKIHPTEKLG